MKNARHLTALIALALIIFAAASASATEGVSPGAADRIAQVNNACPTFSWEASAATSFYEIVAYAIHENDDPATTELTAESEVLYSRISGAATSWTPSAEQCFAPGGRYVWFVRSVTEFAGDEVIDASEWSVGRYFTVPAAPSPEEMQRALDVLRRWEAANGGGSLPLSSAAVAVPAAFAEAASGSGTGSGSSHREGGGEGHPKSVPTASAAIRGANPEYDVEAYGVVGVTNSVYGAGVGAANTEGGPDLLLDGSFDGGADTRVSEWGIDRADPTDQVFYVRNTGGGAMTLDVFGTLRGTALECPGCIDTTDLANEAVGSAQIEYGGVGTDNIDFSAVTSSRIADGTIVSADLADESVTSAKIEVGAVQTAHFDSGAVNSAAILDGTIRAGDLGDGTVTGAKILNGTITAADLAPDSVGSSAIEDGGVATVDLDAGAVGTSQLADAAVTAAKLAPGAIGAGSLADGSVTSATIADGSITGADIGAGEVSTNNYVNFSITTEKLFTGAVTTSKIADGTIGAVDLSDDSVTASKLVDGSVSRSKIGNGAVDSSKIADGSITSADVSELATSGIYVSKKQAYFRNDSTSLPAGGLAAASVECDDPSDLPLQAICKHAEGIESLGGVIEHWTDNYYAANLFCNGRNTTSSSKTIEAMIVCIQN